MIEEYQDYSNWQNRQVPCLQVGHRGGVQRSALQDAINRAKPYTRIILLPGTYTESITIQKPVELIAEDGGEVVFDCRPPCITIAAHVDVYLKKLTLKSKTISTNKTNYDPAALLVSMGRPVVEACALTSIAVTGTSRAYVFHCTITGNGNGSGITIRDTACGTFKNNRIINHTGYGIDISGRCGHDPFHKEQLEREVLLLDAATAIKANAAAGFLVTPTIHVNADDSLNNKLRFEENEVYIDPGMASYGPTDPEGNPLPFQPGKGLVHVSGASASPVFFNNTFTDVLLEKYMRSQATNEFARNPFAQSEETAILAMVDGGPFGSAGSPSSTLTGKSAASFTNNNASPLMMPTSPAYSDTYDGFSSPTAAESGFNFEKPRQRQRAGRIIRTAKDMQEAKQQEMKERQRQWQLISQGKDNFLQKFVPKVPHYSVKDLRVTNASITVEGSATPYFIDNMIEGGEISVSYRHSGGLFRKNKVTGSKSAALFISSESFVRIDGNNFNAHTSAGIVCDRAWCKIYGNTIQACGDIGVSIVACMSPAGADVIANGLMKKSLLLNMQNSNTDVLEAHNNTINECGFGLWVAGLCDSNLSGNTISRCEDYGVKFTGVGCTPLCTKTKVISNKIHGVICERGATPELSSCEIYSQQHGLAVTSMASPMVKSCNIGGNSITAVWCFRNGRGEFHQNKLTGGGGALLTPTEPGCSNPQACSGLQQGIGSGAICVVEDGGDPSFFENTFTNGRVGVLSTEGGLGNFEKNKFSDLVTGARVCYYADPIFDSNTFERCTTEGFVVEEEGIGTLTLNFFESCTVGLRAWRGGEPTVRNNTWKRSRDCGIILGLGSRAVIEKNTISECGQGILLEGEDCLPYVRGNQVKECIKWGILSRHAAQGDVIDNLTVGNSGGGCGTMEQGRSLFKGHRSVMEKGHGIYCIQGGEGTFVDCEALTASGAGVCVEKDAKPTITGGCFSGCSIAGILLNDGAKGSIEGSTVKLNQKGTIFRGGAKTTIVKLIIDDNEDAGVTITEGAEVILNECVFRKHPKVGLCISNAGKSVVSNCRFEDNNIGLESVTGGAHCMVENCIFERSSGAHAAFHRNGEATIKHCQFNGGTIGVHSYENGRGNVIDCEFDNFSVGAVTFENNGLTTVSHCKIQRNIVGVLSRLEGSGYVKECEISMNFTNIRTETSGNTYFYRCRISEGVKEAGLRLDGNGKFVQNQIERNKHGGVQIGNHGKPQLADNQIICNQIAGIIVGDKGDGSIQRNEISGNFGHGVLLRAGSNAQFFSNQIKENNECGVFAEKHSGGLAMQNVISDNVFCNVRLGQLSSTKLDNNEITGGNVGVILEAGSAAKLIRNKIKAHEIVGTAVFGKSVCIIEENFFQENGVGLALVPKRHRDAHVGSSNLTVQFVEGNAAGGTRSRAGSRPGSARSGKSGKSGGGKHGTEAEVVVLPYKKLLHQVSGHFPLELVSVSPSERSYPDGEAIAAALDQSNSQPDQTGTWKLQGASAIIKNNRFYFNKYCGTALHYKSSSKILGNEYEDETVGVSVAADAAGTVEECKFRSCKVGLEVNGIGIATKWRKNQCSKCTVGFRFHFADPVMSSAILENHFKENECGIELMAEAAVHVVQCVFQQDTTGLRSVARNRAKISESIFHHSQVGIQCLPGSRPTVQRCRFKGCFAGVSSQEAAPEIMHCIFADNVTAGVIAEGEPPEMDELDLVLLSTAGEQEPVPNSKSLQLQGTCKRCLFTKSQQSQYSCGVMFRNGTNHFNVDYCHFHYNSVGAIAMGAKTQGIIRNSLFHNQLQFGFHTQEEAKSTVEQCTFARNAHCDAHVISQAAPVISRCLFAGETEVGVMFGEGGSGKVTQCVISNQIFSGVRFVGGEYADVRENFILRCPVGVVAEETWSYGCSACENILYSNAVGLCCRKNGKASFSDNLLTRNDVGIIARECGMGEFERNFVKGCKRGGILVAACEHDLLVAENYVADNAMFGISIAGPICSAVVENNVVANSKTNITCAGGTPIVRSNWSMQGEVGLILHEGTEGTFEFNHVFNNRRTACRIISKLSKISKNCFYSPGDAGALEIEEDSAGASKGMHNNEVRNNFVPHWRVPDPPTKVSLPDITEQKYQATSDALLETLKDVIQHSLPICEDCKCTFLVPKKDGEASDSDEPDDSDDVVATEAITKRLTRRKSLEGLLQGTAPEAAVKFTPVEHIPVLSLSQKTRQAEQERMQQLLEQAQQHQQEMMKDMNALNNNAGTARKKDPRRPLVESTVIDKQATALKRAQMTTMLASDGSVITLADLGDKKPEGTAVRMTKGMATRMAATKAAREEKKAQELARAAEEEELERQREKISLQRAERTKQIHEAAQRSAENKKQVQRLLFRMGVAPVDVWQQKLWTLGITSVAEVSKTPPDHLVSMGLASGIDDAERIIAAAADVSDRRQPAVKGSRRPPNRPNNNNSSSPGSKPSMMSPSLLSEEGGGPSSLRRRSRSGSLSMGHSHPMKLSEEAVEAQPTEDQELLDLLQSAGVPDSCYELLHKGGVDVDTLSCMNAQEIVAEFGVKFSKGVAEKLLAAVAARNSNRKPAGSTGDLSTGTHSAGDVQGTYSGDPFHSAGEEENLGVQFNQFDDLLSILEAALPAVTAALRASKVTTVGALKKLLDKIRGGKPLAAEEGEETVEETVAALLGVSCSEAEALLGGKAGIAVLLAAVTKFSAVHSPDSKHSTHSSGALSAGTLADDPDGSFTASLEAAGFHQYSHILAANGVYDVATIAQLTGKELKDLLAKSDPHVDESVVQAILMLAKVTLMAHTKAKKKLQEEQRLQQQQLQTRSSSVGTHSFSRSGSVKPGTSPTDENRGGRVFPRHEELSDLLHHLGVDDADVLLALKRAGVTVTTLCDMSLDGVEAFLQNILLSDTGEGYLSFVAAIRKDAIRRIRAWAEARLSALSIPPPATPPPHQPRSRRGSVVGGRPRRVSVVRVVDENTEPPVTTIDEQEVAALLSSLGMPKETANEWSVILRNQRIADSVAALARAPPESLAQVGLVAAARPDGQAIIAAAAAELEIRRRVTETSSVRHPTPHTSRPGSSASNQRDEGKRTSLPPVASPQQPKTTPLPFPTTNSVPLPQISSSSALSNMQFRIEPTSPGGVKARLSVATLSFNDQPKHPRFQQPAAKTPRRTLSSRELISMQPIDEEALRKHLNDPKINSLVTGRGISSPKLPPVSKLSWDHENEKKDEQATAEQQKKEDERKDGETHGRQLFDGAVRIYGTGEGSRKPLASAEHLAMLKEEVTAAVHSAAAMARMIGSVPLQPAEFELRVEIGTPKTAALSRTSGRNTSRQMFPALMERLLRSPASRGPRASPLCPTPPSPPPLTDRRDLLKQTWPRGKPHYRMAELVQQTPIGTLTRRGISDRFDPAVLPLPF